MKPMIFHSNGTALSDLPSEQQKQFDGQVVQLLDDGKRGFGDSLDMGACFWAMFPDGTPRIVWPDELTDSQDGVFRQQVLLLHLEATQRAQDAKETLRICEGTGIGATRSAGFHEGQRYAYLDMAGALERILHPEESAS